MKKVLVLDQSYMPVIVVNWKRAITLLFLNKVEVVEEYDNEFVNSSNKQWKLPSVVRFVVKFNRNKRIVKYTKSNVFARDRYCCQYCGNKFPLSYLTCDHVYPRSKGGRSDWNNVITACKKCNEIKGDKTIEEFGVMPKRLPVEPGWMSVLIYKIFDLNEDIPKEWRNYCYM